LVIARVGRGSLHQSWVERGSRRDWDLYLCPYEEIPPQTGLECTVGEVMPGPKWTGLRNLLNEWDGWREYDRIWLPDDDIRADQHSISAMFQAAAALEFSLFAPALHESSFYEHYTTMRNQEFFARRVGFVEIMVPGFSRSALELLLPTFDLTASGWGWGLDPLWAKLLDHEGLGILDGIPVLHTRPVGQYRDAELHRRLSAEAEQIMADHQASMQLATFVGIGPDLQDMELSPDELLVKLVQGWDHLYAGNPAVLRHIYDNQAPTFHRSTASELRRPSLSGHLPDVAGTPACRRPHERGEHVGRKTAVDA
jgi:hypothetical protein